MATVTGPMFSLKASGTLADTLTFRTNGRRHSVGKKNVPTQPRSNSQIKRRAMTKWLTQTWRQLPDYWQSNLDDIAQKLNLSNYHAWLKFNSLRWNSDQLPWIDGIPGQDTNETNESKVVTKIGRLHSFVFKVEDWAERYFTCIINAMPAEALLWNPAKTILVLGPPVNWVMGNSKFVGTWEAPNDNNFYFHAKYGTIRGDSTNPYIT